MQTFTINQVGYRDIGQERKENEDFLISYRSPDQHFVYSIIADGMGGYKGGAIASELAATQASIYLTRHLGFVSAQHEFAVTDQLKFHVEHAIKLANEHVLTYKAQNPELADMGTTLVIAVIWHNQLLVANIGDSRAYLYCKKTLRQLSKDHSTVQEMIDNGALTTQTARSASIRNQLTQAIGVSSTVDVFFATHLLEDSGSILLCTDGLTEYVDRYALETELSHGLPASQSCFRLIEMANQKGGKDNITVAIVEYGDSK